MNAISRTIAGIASIILGLCITFAAISDKPEDWFWALVWGIFFVVIGIFIFLINKEDDIEEIKNNK